MTELIWEGKYKDGKKVTPVRIALPFQTIETVNESAQQRQKTLDFFAAEPTADFNNKEWRNRLIWGDKKYVLPSLLPEFAGKVNLIYIDPPFNVGSDFSFTATIADNPDSEEDETTEFVKQPSIIEQKAYRDTWGKGLDSYMQWFYETVLLLKELLAEDGSIYVHLDWHVSHYAKTILDEVFGYENFKNEIIWQRTTNTGSSKGMANKLSNDTDSILYYTKSNKSVFNKQFKPYSQEYLDRFKFEDSKGKYRWQYMATYSDKKLKELEAQDMIRWQKGSANPEYKQYIEGLKGIPLNNLWSDIFHVNPMALEKVNYNTQKPEQLLERIINISSNDGDLVLDCFCGSGTTAATSEKLNRRWITCDLGRFAIHTARKRFLGITNVKPFIVQNLGKYERQQWMNVEFESPEDRFEQEKTYRHFILELYHAKSLDGYTWLHGAKAGKMIHVGGVETPVTVDDIKATIKEFWKLVGKEKSVEKNHIDFLGWDFAFDVNETAKQFAAENNVQIHPIKIPREVLEKKAVDQGDIKFYELASLGIKTKTNKLAVSVTLDNFTIPPDDVPQDVQGKITHWSQWIDYWAIDWNYRDDTFHNEWQSYRTKQNPKIELVAGYAYEKKGKYTVLVKVIDILGNDTTKAIEITV
ncbi:MAG: site-specific DNA-methyltransferase [Cytophagales bacterium]|jgi:DNA modification methylase|nr:site-specific DNA-methyltransferase [Cytophagales bacterium]MCA6368834.1 site-specific DNA-methyltransferase [Cytophagales bacterium]MCA6373166.1 site-specific DNA-methyltransferase [Cytophagales bacterium]MCA6377288.1 site-specific DNA-methyltransferase [Cytophagales bacterium]MCA6383065.1 site-specific DNA-methyltransferase [Cytophagales bacterium]